MRFNSKLFFFLSVLFIFSCKGTKETVAKTTTPKVENYDLENALLWEIDGNGLTEPSYLFGTIHMIEAESFYWPEGTLAAFDDSENVAFEVDLDDMFDMGSMMGLLQTAFMKDNAKLSDFYTDEEWKEVEGHFEGMGLPMMFLEKIKPMFLTVFASGDVEMGQGFGEGSGIKSYEMELYTLSQDSGKDVDGLETMEFQMSVFDSIPYQDQADMLLQTIQSGGEGDASFDAMIEMYVNQDINKMVSMMSEEEGIEGFEDILLYQRNRNWIPVMAKKMTQAQTFFAVGAGHLGGKDGVIDLLKKEGYKLKPLSHKKGM